MEDTLATAASRSRGNSPNISFDRDGFDDASRNNNNNPDLADSPPRTVSFSTLPPQQFSGDEAMVGGRDIPARTASNSSMKPSGRISAFTSPLRTSTSTSSFKSTQNTPSPNNNFYRIKGTPSPLSSRPDSPAGRHASSPELTPPQPDKPAQPKRFYTWQLGKGSSNYKKILERRREMLRSKDLAGSEVLRTEWVDLITELDTLVNAGVERLVKRIVTATRRTKSSGDAFDKMRSLGGKGVGKGAGPGGRHSAPPSASKSMESVRSVEGTR